MQKSLDNNFYSRQIGTYGIGTQMKIMKMNTFIYGMRGVGIETAKNLVLAGPKSLTIFDPSIVKINDLSSNFFLKEEDVNNCIRRDAACTPYLSKLNPDVILNIMDGDDIIQDIKKKLNNLELKYNVIVITEFLPKNKIIEIDELCRNNNIGFILSLELGIFSYIFVDFGNNFTIYDETGEEVKEYLIEKITKEKEGKVLINSKLFSDIKLSSNDYVSFKEIEGMTELNNITPFKIRYIHENIIEICDTSKFSDYIRGGTIYNVKLPKIIKFDSFKERIEEPIKENEKYVDPMDLKNINIQEILRIGILALFDFYDKNNNLPKINEKNDAEELLKISKNILEQKEKEGIYWVKYVRSIIEDSGVNFDLIFEKTIKYLSYWAKVEISPISSFIGGITSQEIIKFSGKYKPIHQWLYCDFSQIVENLDVKEKDREMLNSRYDDQIAIFGKETQKKLSETNIFMIGGGALGCEYAKIFATMGLCTGENKNLYITDNDRIEISNLNRQFLFHKNTVGRSKSEVICETIKKMNKDFNCVSFQKRLNEESEDVFNEEFWNKQDYIIMAVDNKEARKYIADQSKIYNKILFDSGTLGTKANSQVIIPHKTMPYIAEEGKKEDDEYYHICTLPFHPFNIIHCIQWANDKFNEYFVNNLEEVKKFLENRQDFYESDFENLKKLFEYSKIVIEKNFEKCVEIALNQYYINFINDILILINSYSEKGKEFWTGDKRYPHPIPFNKDNKYALLFVKKYSQILGRSLGIKITDDDEQIINIISKIKIKEYVPIKKNNNSSKEFTSIMTKEEREERRKRRKKEEEQQQQQKNKYIKEINSYFKSIDKKINFSDLIKIEEFDKDDESKGHVEFLYAFANLRAENYNIDKCDISKVKIVSGKIVPAIASTTAAIVGIVALQLYVLKTTDDIEKLRNCYFNLASKVFKIEDPIKCRYIEDWKENKLNKEEKYKLIPEKFTVWDFLFINKSQTIRELIAYMKNKYNVDVSAIIDKETKCLFKKGDQNLDDKIEDVYNNKSNIKLSENKKYLILEILGNIGDYSAKMPLFKYNFKN